MCGSVNPLKPTLNVQHKAWPTIFNLTFGRSGAERQSARMSEIKNGRLGLYGKM